MSDGVRALFGVAPGTPQRVEQLVGLVHPDDRDEVRAGVARAFDEGGPTSVAFRVTRPDGSTVWVESRAEVVTTADGERRLAGVVLDVTDRHLAEEAVRAQARLLDVVRQAVVATDLDGRITYWNHFAETLFGWTAEEVIGRTTEELIRSPAVRVEAGRMMAALARGEAFEGELPALDKHGRPFVAFVAAAAIVEDGRPVGAVAVSTDVTERHRMEAELRESESRFRAMADDLPLLVWMYDPAGRLALVNRTFLEFVGRPHAELLEGGWAALVHPDDVAAHRDSFARCVADHLPFHVQLRVRRHDGEWRWLESWGRPRFSPSGAYLGHLGTSADVTERRCAEDALRHAEAVERRARRRLELLASLSQLGDVRGAEERARRLVSLLVPRLADVATVELPGDHGIVHADDAGPAAAGGAPPHSELTVRIPLGERLTGSLSVGLVDAGRPPYADDDRAFVEQVADRIGVLLGNARLYEREHAVALRLQHALLPAGLVESPGVELAARYEAASAGLEVGGDWYDTMPLADGRLAITVGDVVGHGLDAASAMGRLRHAIEALAPGATGPADLLVRLDRYATDRAVTTFATACVAVLDPTTGVLRYASAGHPPMLLVAPDATTRWLDGARSAPLCSIPVATRPEEVVVLQPGTTVVLFSDGLVERRRRPLHVGLERLARVARGLAGAAPEALCDAIVEELTADALPEDDVVVLCLRLGAATTRTFHRRFPARPEELAPLRAALRAWLDGLGLEPRDQYHVLLVTGEACANAVEHAYDGAPGGEVVVTLGPDGGGIVLEVSDGGTWRPPAPLRGDRGRGTGIMDSLSQSFRRQGGPRGTTVTCRIPVGGRT